MPLVAVLDRLPLFDELYLLMQARNVSVVDGYLEEMETETRRLHIELERTPGPQLMVLSAFSQMWVFALYELLRTWRQRIDELIRFGQELQGLAPAKRRRVVQARADALGNDTGNVALMMRKDALRRVATTRYLARLIRVRERVMPFFRRLEALRVTLAKHEVPRTSRSALAPGYTRIHPLDGSASWMIELKDGTVDMWSRRGIADDLRRIWTKDAPFLGPAA